MIRKDMFGMKMGKKRSYGVVYDVDNIAMKVNAPIVLYKNKKELYKIKKSSFDLRFAARLKANIDVNLVGKKRTFSNFY